MTIRRSLLAAGVLALMVLPVTLASAIDECGPQHVCLATCGELAKACAHEIREDIIQCVRTDCADESQAARQVCHDLGQESTECRTAKAAFFHCSRDCARAEAADVAACRQELRDCLADCRHGT